MRSASSSSLVVNAAACSMAEDFGISGAGDDNDDDQDSRTTRMTQQTPTIPNNNRRQSRSCEKRLPADGGMDCRRRAVGSGCCFAQPPPSI
jgi:hypothetical protein